MIRSRGRWIRAGRSTDAQAVPWAAVYESRTTRRGLIALAVVLTSSWLPWV